MFFEAITLFFWYDIIMRKIVKKGRGNLLISDFEQSSFNILGKFLSSLK